MNKHSLLIKFILLLMAIVPFHATNAGYSGPPTSPEERARFVRDFQDDPEWLRNNVSAIARLKPQELKELVEAMDFTHYTFLHVVKIKGQELGDALLGKKVEDISVMSVRGGQLKPIPYQIDEFDDKLGWIYVPGKSPAKAAGTYLALDEGDELIIMYRDTGKQRFDPTTMNMPAGKIVKELKFTPKIGPVRYAYVLEDNPQRSKVDYSDIQIKKDGTFVQTSFYSIESAPESFIEFRDFQAHIGPKQFTTVVDSIRISAAAGILAKWARASIDNDNIRIHIVGAHDGAVRVASLAKLEILFAGVQIFSLYTQVNFYDQGIHIPNRTELGAASYFARVFRDPVIEVALDFVDVTGAVVSAASVWDDYGTGVVDGVMTEMETIVNERPLPGDWVWMNSQQGWDVFMQISMPDALTDGMHTAMLYLDDPNAHTDWEKYPGAMPRIGIRTVGLPDSIEYFHELELDIGIWFPDTVGDPGPKVFFEEVTNPPVVTVQELDKESVAAL